MPDFLKTEAVLQGQCRTTSDLNLVYTTVLGSCVAVCLYDPIMSVGGMNHFLLPGGDGDEVGDMRFGVHSMELLINDLLKLGARKTALEAKLYGGASVIKSRGKIGQSNSAFARSFVQREGIRCIEQELGGFSARRIKFRPSTGDVEHIVVPEASDLSETVQRQPVRRSPNDVTLF